MQSIIVEQELLFSFADGLPWPVIVISGDGHVIRVTRDIPGLEDAHQTNERSNLAALFPEYFSILRGSVRWLVPQEAELTRQLTNGIVHERIILCRVLTGAFLIIQDQTWLRTLEISNVQTARLAALGFMVAGVCHEVSNPLTSIYSIVQILRSDEKKESGFLDKGLKSIATNVTRLLGISRRLLNFGRVGDEQRSTFPVDEAIKEAFVIIRQDAGAQDVSLEFEPDPDAVIFGSINQMQQVFVNIFDNAIQAMRGVGKLSVKTLRSDGERITVWICDTGPGISEEALPRLFEPFFTTKQTSRGSGLGLTISHEILREHNGLIEAKNNADAGACFCVDLPLYKGNP
ncbi:sensor histidine kinase [Glaciimonas immobilis]|uniref:histidine kinase n=1 Tax=Glaciimonas immobilis TaxID=728004 RepID=A0A840RMS2_9BURK|nr:ATP-binding protein [Glaciimonas immobilis]KAF3999527.1 two-component sensor histidine kinase [Glaciimonas immobilis]MBB5199063.1 signal transduction histidine kinase [Glaciimonas immobilis]